MPRFPVPRPNPQPGLSPRDREGLGRVGEDLIGRAAEDAGAALGNAARDVVVAREEHHAAALEHDRVRRAELAEEEANFPVPNVKDYP